jgi:chromosome segregation ATPase
MNQKDNLIAHLKSNFDEKFRELNHSILTLKDEIQSKDNEITQKTQLIEDLEAADQENKLGINDLRANLETRLNKLNEEMTEKQMNYENTQFQVGQSFQEKVLELDSQMISLQDDLSQKEVLLNEMDEKIKDLQKQNQKLQYYESKVKEYESKIQKYESKLNQIAEILEYEKEEENKEEFEESEELKE